MLHLHYLFVTICAKIVKLNRPMILKYYVVAESSRHGLFVAILVDRVCRDAFS